MPVIVGSCASYNKPFVSRSVKLAGFERIDKGLCARKLESFPRRIRKNDNFTHRNLTSDSVVFFSDCDHWLFISGAYDRKNKLGYALFHTRFSEDSILSQCILFNRIKHQTNICIYQGPGTANSWRSMRPYITPENEWLFWGFTMNKREERRWKRHMKLKRIFNLKP